MKKTLAALAAMFAAASVWALPAEPLSVPDSFSIEGSFCADVHADSASTEIDSSPAFSFTLGKVETRGRPAEVAAFLERIGSVDTAFQIFAGLKQRNSQSTSNMDNTTVGFDVDLHYVWDVLPISLELPLTEKRIRWKYTEEDTAAILHYHTMGLLAGYYVLPNLEISAGMGYLQPDLFFKDSSTDTRFRYLGWDIGCYLVKARAAFSPLPGQWIYAEPSFTLLKDEEENTVSGLSLRAVYYPIPALGLEGFFSSSTYKEGKTYSNPLFSVMGVTEIGCAVSADLFSLARLRVYGSLLTPEDSDYQGVIVFGASVTLVL